MPQIIENVFEFKKRHGEELEIGGAIYFPDGAAMDTMGLLRREPPEDPAELLENQHKWYAEKLRLEEQEFHHVRAGWIQQNQVALQSDNAPPAPQDAVDQLLAGKTRCDILRQRVAELAEQLAVESPVARMHDHRVAK